MGERGLGLGLPASRRRSSGAGRTRRWRVSHALTAVSTGPEGRRRSSCTGSGGAAPPAWDARRAGHGSKAAAGSALGSILRWWTANRRGSFLGRRERKKVPAMDELAGKRPEKGKRRGNSQTVMDSRKEGHYGVENDEIYLVVVVVDAET